MDADDSNPVQLTFNNAFDGQPSFSPDGSKIIFTSDLSGNSDVWVMDADGSNLTQITTEAWIDSQPCWKRAW